MDWLSALPLGSSLRRLCAMRRCRAFASGSTPLGAVLLAALGIILGCARYQRVGIESDPVGAEVFVDGRRVGVAPLDVSIDRDRDHLVFLKLDGYVPARAVLTLNQAPDDIDFLTPADVVVRLVPRVGRDQDQDGQGDEMRNLEVEVEEGKPAAGRRAIDEPNPVPAPGSGSEESQASPPPDFPRDSAPR